MKNIINIEYLGIILVRIKHSLITTFFLKLILIEEIK